MPGEVAWAGYGPMAITALPADAIRYINLSGQPHSHGATLMGTNNAEFLQLAGIRPVQQYPMYCRRQLVIDPAENIRRSGNLSRRTETVLPLAKMISFATCAAGSLA